MCVEIFDSAEADRLKSILKDCDCARLSDGFWYRFTKKGVTKEKAIMEIEMIGTNDNKGIADYLLNTFLSD